MNENILIGLVEELRGIRKGVDNLECQFRQLRKENAKQHKAIERRLSKVEDRVTR